MKFDEILVHIGEFGPYQKRVYFLLALPAILCGAQVMSVVFTLAIPEYRCAIPGWDNDTWAVQGSTHAELINLTIPLDDGAYDGCTLYTDVNVSSILEWISENMTDSKMKGLVGQGNRSTSDCDAWVYDHGEFTNTIMTEFDSYCDDAVFRSHGNMAAAVGCMFGAIIMGAVADIFGRKKAICLALVLHCLTTLAISLAPNIVVVIVFMAINGVATHATFAIAITTGLEMVGPSKRSLAGMAIEFYWTIGVLFCLPIAYVLREWRDIQLTLCLLSVPMFALWCLIPESPRWLLEKKRYKETEMILEKICRSNHTVLPPGAVDASTDDQGEEIVEAKLSEVLHHRTLMLRTLLIFFNWLAVSMLYYGLSLNVGNLGGSTYLNYMYGTLVEGLGYAITLMLLDRLGRRRLFCGCMLTGGVACVAVLFPEYLGGADSTWVVTVLAMVGKCGVSAGYAIIYIMSAELFPTVIRNSALGACAIFENIGGIVAPYIADLGVITNGHDELPLVIFGCVAIVSGVLSMALPETLGKKLPETIQDAIDFSENRDKWDYEEFKASISLTASGKLGSTPPKTFYKQDMDESSVRLLGGGKDGEGYGTTEDV